MLSSDVKKRLVSLSGLVLADFGKEQQIDRQFKKVKKRLVKDYTPAKVEKLQNKYLKNPEVFRMKFDALVEQFVEDYALYRTSLKDFLETIRAQLQALEREQYAGLVKMENLLAQIENKSPAGIIYVGPNIKRRFEQEFSIAMRSLTKQLQKSYARLELARTYMQRQQTRWFVARWFQNSRFAERLGMRSAARLRDQIERTKQWNDRIAAQLAMGVRPDFMMLLLRFITEMEQTHKLLEAVRKDIIIMVQDVCDTITTVSLYTAKFVTIIMTDKNALAKIQAARNAMNVNLAAVLQLIVEDEKMLSGIAAEAQQLTNRETRFIAALTAMNENEIKKNFTQIRHNEGAALRQAA